MFRNLFLAFAMTFLIAGGVNAQVMLVTPLDEKTLSVELQTIGDNYQEAVELAKQQAVNAATGRIFLTDQLILADDLLRKYISNYAADFVDAVEVLDEQYFEGRNRVRSRVFVDFERLFNDLQEKKFLYKPAYKPSYTTFMTERLGERVVTAGVARDSLSQALTNLGMLYYPNELPTPPSTTDVSDDSFLLKSAIVSSQRSGVEVIISGQTRTELVRREKLYFDEYWFYDTEMVASLIRVDTGEVLFTAEGSGSASATDQQEAIQTSIDRAAAEVSGKLVEDFQKYWPTVVQQKADYQILFTGVNEELLNIIIQNIERMGRQTDVYIRKSFGTSSVVEIVTPASKEDLLENLNSSTYPTLYILNPEADKSFEVQVSS